MASSWVLRGRSLAPLASSNLHASHWKTARAATHGLRPFGAEIDEAFIMRSGLGALRRGWGVSANDPTARRAAPSRTLHARPLVRVRLAAFGGRRALNRCLA